MRAIYDVVIAGGGPAGMSAALMLVRSRRSVLVIDGESPRNRFAGHMHGVLGHDGRSPGHLRDVGRRELASYGGELHVGEIESARDDGSAFALTTAGGERTRARRLVVATGLRDELPPIPGLAEQWGRGVVMCPYCDGYEMRDRRIGILGTGPGSAHQAQLMRQLSSDVIYFDRWPEIEADALLQLRARGIAVRAGVVSEVVSEGGALRGVRIDGDVVDLDALFVAPRLLPRDALLASLDARRIDTPAGSFVATDGTGKTSVAGVWAVGNVANFMANVPMAIGAGSAAGAAVNMDLVAEEIDAALRPAVARA